MRGGNMLRGTNKSIIEISETENKYFEKALLFVKPEFINLPPERLNREARKMIGSLIFSPMGLTTQTSARKMAAKRKRKKLLFLVGFLVIVGFTIWKIV